MSSTINILHTIRQGRIGGGESHVLSLVSRLDPELYRSVVISFTDGPMVDALKKMQIPVYVIETTTPFNPLITKQVDDVVRKEQIDLIHAHGTRAASNSYRSAKNAGKPLVYTVHGWSFHEDQPALTYFTRKSSEEFLVNQASETICVSHANLSLGKELFDMPRSCVVHNGVDFQRFNKSINSKSNLRAELGIPEDKFCFAYIVRLTKQKDPFTFIQAIAIATHKNPNIHALIVGDGELREKAEKMAVNLDCEKNITFAGFRQDIPEVLAAVDSYVLPSLWEGLPIGIIEAMAMEKAVLASDIAANAELITHGYNGLLVSVKKPKQLADCMHALSEDKNLVKSLGGNAYKDAREKYDLELMTNKVASVYQRHAKTSNSFKRVIRRFTHEMPN